ncbi:MAG: tetratricopeptide repeat protein, partial [Planctomycetes bacterium]|nr:tetratricopeptide repeat protein [Planctomycetota bacterium]
MDVAGADFKAAVEMFRGGQADEAMAACREVIARQPACAAAHHLLAAIELQRGNPAAAWSSAEKAVELDPNHWTHHNTLGCVLNELEEPGPALASYRRGLRIAPNTAELYNNLARAQSDLGAAAEAEASYREALRLDPAYAEAIYNLANLCRDGGRFDEAIDLYDAALRQQEDMLLARRNRGLALLEMGRFADGWAEYDWRWSEPQRTRPGGLLDVPPWQGEPLGGRTILIHAEQGVGDEVMFASCYAEMIALAGCCVLTCDPRLASLFGRSFPSAVVSAVRRGEECNWRVPPEVTIDFQIAAGDLPRYLRPSDESFPRQRQFLSADRDQRASWRRRLASLGDGLNVGISWRAGQTRQEQRKRSIPLDVWGPLLGTAGVNFVSLQYGDCRQQIAHVAADIGVTIHTFSDLDPTHDLDQLSAVISALDLVISVGNTTVHLAGGLGTPVWAMLPPAGTWPWTQGRDGALWYQSVRLMRAPVPGEWTELLERVREELVGETERRRDGGKESGREHAVPVGS